MIYKKHNKTKNFTIIDNGILQNKNLSLQAKGLICLMLSLPDNWAFNKNGLISSSKNGKDSLESIINELKQNNYLKITHKGNEWVWDIFEEPISDADFQCIEKQCIEKQCIYKGLNIQRTNNNKEIINKDNTMLAKASNSPLVKVNENEFIDYFSKVCPSLPQIKAMTDKRKKAINSILKQYGQDKFIEVLKKTEDSDFLSGRSGKWGSCNIDWIIKPSNFIKILEGNYDNYRQRETEDKKIEREYKKTIIQKNKPKSIQVAESFEKTQSYINKYKIVKGDKILDANNRGQFNSS